LLRFLGRRPKVLPPLVLLLNNISPFPFRVVVSPHTTYTLLPDTAIRGANESPRLLLRFIGMPKVIPPSVLFLKNILLLVGVKSYHTTYTELPITATFFCWPASVVVLVRLVFVLSDGEAAAADADCLENTHDEIIINDKSIIVI
jgi:hypothetical protein